MDKILVSIVVPIYNVKPFLVPCLDSIEKQVFTSYEVILIDDGSTDGSGELAQEYAIEHDNWKVLKKENGGLSSARNLGITEAKGKYICFVDSDDYIESDYLQKLYEAAVLYQADMVIADYHEVDVDGRDLYKEKGDEIYQQGILMRDEALEALTSVGECHFATAIVVAWNKLVKTEIMKSFSYPAGVLHEDEFLIMPLLLACSKVAWIRDDVYAYRQRKGSIMQDEKEALRHLKILDAFEERIHLATALDNEELLNKFKRCYLWDIEIWYYFMRIKYGLRGYKLYGYFARRMWKALVRYGRVVEMHRLIKYIIFACAPEVLMRIKKGVEKYEDIGCK